MSDMNLVITNNIRNLLLKCNVSNVELAKKINITKPEVNYPPPKGSGLPLNGSPD